CRRGVAREKSPSPSGRGREARASPGAPASVKLSRRPLPKGEGLLPNLFTASARGIIVSTAFSNIAATCNDLSSITGGRLKQKFKYGALYLFIPILSGAPDSQVIRLVSLKLGKSMTRSNRRRRTSRTNRVISRSAADRDPSRIATRSTANVSSTAGHSSAIGVQRCP